MLLPRPELPKYPGDPLELIFFLKHGLMIKSFCFACYFSIAWIVFKEQIQHFAVRGELCCQLAKERLYKKYGLSWVVVDVCKQRLKEFPNIKSGDAKQIKRFAELLEATLATVTSMNNIGSLNTLATLTLLVGNLPSELR